jgi:hypothetical protein
MNNQEEAEFVAIQWQQCWLSLLGQTTKDSRPYNEGKSLVNGYKKFVILTLVNYSFESP